MKRYYFRKSQRLRTNAEFRRILDQRLGTSRGLMKLYMAPNGDKPPRLGVSVNRHCGTAVLRNRLKRLGRAVFRTHQHDIPAGFDYLLIFSPKMTKKAKSAARSIAAEMTFERLETAFLEMVDSLAARRRKSGRDRKDGEAGR